VQSKAKHKLHILPFIEVYLELVVWNNWNKSVALIEVYHTVAHVISLFFGIKAVAQSWIWNLSFHNPPLYHWAKSQWPHVISLSVLKKNCPCSKRMSSSWDCSNTDTSIRNMTIRIHRHANFEGKKSPVQKHGCDD